MVNSVTNEQQQSGTEGGSNSTSVVLAVILGLFVLCVIIGTIIAFMYFKKRSVQQYKYKGLCIVEYS